MPTTRHDVLGTGQKEGKLHQAILPLYNSASINAPDEQQLRAVLSEMFMYP
jgi:hypothetical protein